MTITKIQAKKTIEKLRTTVMNHMYDGAMMDPQDYIQYTTEREANSMTVKELKTYYNKFIRTAIMAGE